MGRDASDHRKRACREGKAQQTAEVGMMQIALAVILNDWLNVQLGLSSNIR